MKQRENRDVAKAQSGKSEEAKGKRSKRMKEYYIADKERLKEYSLERLRGLVKKLDRDGVPLPADQGHPDPGSTKKEVGLEEESGRQREEVASTENGDMPNLQTCEIPA